MPQNKKRLRDEAVMNLVKRKVRYDDIAKDFDITKGRIAQIVKENKAKTRV